MAEEPVIANEVKQSLKPDETASCGDCFVTSFLAMTNNQQRISRQKSEAMTRYIYKGIGLNKSTDLPILHIGHKCLKTKNIWI